MPHNDGEAAPDRDGLAKTQSPAKSTTSSPSYLEGEGLHRAELAFHRPAAARLSHGLNLWEDTDIELHAERVAAHWSVADMHGLAIAPPFTAADWRFSLEMPDERDWRRTSALLDNFMADHEDEHWFWSHPFCAPCRGDRRLARASLHRWLYLHPGKNPPAADLELPALPRVNGATDHRSAFLTLDDLAALPEPVMMAEEVLPIGGHGLITGRDGTYKTFLALDLALSVATGSAWHGRVTDFDGHGRVLFLAGEGVRSFGARIGAWEAAHRPLHPWERERVLVRNGTVALDRPSEALAELSALVGTWRPDLIVFDTLQRSAGGADQNSASEMAVVTERVATLRALAGNHCTTVLVAHTTKADTDARGSSSIEDDADFVLHCKREDTRLKITVVKMKDGESGQTITLHPTARLDSLVLADQPDPARAIVWTSASPENKVLSALKALEPLGPQLQSEIVRQAEVDQAAVSRALARLLNDGAVARVGPAGRGARFTLPAPTTGGEDMA